MDLALACGTEAIRDLVRPFQLELRIRIRQAAERDLQPLEWFGLFSGHREIIQAAFDRQVLGDMDMLVADLNGFPVGQVWVDYRAANSDDGASVWAVRVLPPLRRLGIGERMMQAAEASAGRRGETVTSLTVERRNADARRFYERLGYRIVDPPPDYEEDTRPGARTPMLLQTQWLMRKTLEPQRGAPDARCGT